MRSNGPISGFLSELCPTLQTFTAILVLQTKWQIIYSGEKPYKNSILFVNEINEFEA